MSILQPTPPPADEDRAPTVWLPNRPGASVRTYRGRSLEALLPRIRQELGDDAVILREREGLMGGVGGFFATRFVEVEARAGVSIDVYDEDEDETETETETETANANEDAHANEIENANAGLRALPASAAEDMEISALPAPSDFSARLQEAVKAWSADAEERPIEAATAERVGAEPAEPELALVESADDPIAQPTGESEDSQRLPAIAEPVSAGASTAAPAKRAISRTRAKLPRRPAAPRPVDSDAASRVLGELIELGVSDRFARELIGSAAAHGCVVPGGLRSAVRAELTRRLAPTASLPAHGGTVAFVGAGGSGKSLAAAALAVTYRYGSSLSTSVGSLCDSAAQRHLAETLASDGVPVTRVPEPGARRASASLTQIAAERQQGMVILDTPAVSPTDPLAVAQLADRLEEIAPDAVYLVLSATLGAAAARRALAGLLPLAPTGTVISHADETDQVGVLIELAATEGLPVAYLTAGADHHRSLIGTDPAAVARLLLP